jgi:small-conductance mechanosensitive channel
MSRGGFDMNDSIIHGERYPARVAATFDSRDEARRAAEHLLSETELSSDQVRLIDPSDASVAQTIEPEKRGIWRTLVRSHLVLGFVGLTVGLVVAAGLLIADMAFVNAQPMMVIVSLAVFGLVLGLLAGGLATLRPDHSRIYMMTRDAARASDWVVVALAAGSDQRKHAREVLSRHADHVVQSA